MRKSFVIILFLSQLLLSQVVYVYISEQTIDEVNGGTLGIDIENTADVYGFQFTMNTDGLVGSGDVVYGNSGSGGSAAGSGFAVSVAPTSGVVLGFSFTGSYILAGESVLTQISWNGLVLGLAVPITLQ